MLRWFCKITFDRVTGDFVPHQNNIVIAGLTRNQITRRRIQHSFVNLCIGAATPPSLEKRALAQNLSVIYIY